ncbi:preprotein translocase subunit SecG [Pelagerythrobacter rhizovicinus]|uniref:Protein-export membrane protein SecG n=1 Tax=Pelagerythrobacter rhizovicinus TaxID=2268576 RepID=A0A4Q2KRV1_9SPHN|nr:preprotein translocase subunit SecG [Pelagerythrobacter rhizovicinus]RXZ66061.1 preprotein translocase subunit SecG [Pelagerythrobacter rhizovicinus]
MSLFIFLFVLQAIVAAALVGVVLMQRSEGGGLGIGGSPTGLMSARGAADFLTRATKWLAIMFVLLSIALAAIAAETSGQDSITSTLDRSAAEDPLGQAAGSAQQPAAPATQTPAPASDDPLADVTE